MALRYEQQDRVVTITLDRPEAMNAIDPETHRDLVDAWTRFRDDADAWVAILTGAGEKAFSAGADLKKLIPRAFGATGAGRSPNDLGLGGITRGLEVWKPIIAAVNGFCTAGGMEMLGGCDIRIAVPEAKFAVMEPKRGLFAGGGTTVRLPRQIPWPLAMEFLLCADLIPATRAFEMGLLNAVVPSEELMDAAYEFARRMTANAPLAVQATKQSALQALYVDEDATKTTRRAAREIARLLDGVDTADASAVATCFAEIQERLVALDAELRTAFEKESALSSWIFSTDDAQEGPKAFAEKRPPNWQAR
jgi:enoyl-CoA hydratase